MIEISTYVSHHYKMWFALILLELIPWNYVGYGLCVMYLQDMDDLEWKKKTSFVDIQGVKHSSKWWVSAKWCVSWSIIN